MTSDVILQRLEAEFDSSPEHIRAIVELCENGATPSFIALFRRDESGDLGEARIHELASRFHFLAELDLRKTTIREKLAVGTDFIDLGDIDLAECYDRELLDDVDHALRPHDQQTQRARAKKLGLSDFVTAIHEHRLGDKSPQDAAAEYVKEDDATPAESAESTEDVAPVAPAAVEPTTVEPTAIEPAAVESAAEPVVDQANTAETAATEPIGESPPPESPGAGSSTADSTTAESPITDSPAADSPAADSPAADSPTEDSPAAKSTATEPNAPAANTTSATQPPPPTPAAKPPRRRRHPLSSADGVLELAVRALSERYGEDPQLRRSVRSELSRGNLTARAAAPGKAKGRQASRKRGPSYEDFFDFQEPIRRIAAPRMLTLRKAEREGIIRVRLELPANRELELFRARFSPDVAPDSPLGALLDVIYRHSYEHHVHHSCEGIVRHDLKEVADRETVQNFGHALRAQLMSPPLGRDPAIAVRASGKAVWIASVQADGGLGPRHTLGLSEPAHHEAAAKVLAEMIRDIAPRAIAVPHGRGQPLARKFVDAAFEVLDKDATASALKKPLIVSVDETAAMVYATSATGRRKLPGTDTGMRATISLVRRLYDPLRELIRVEPRGFGLGHNLTEVHQGMLTRTLESVSGSCVARVGVDVNRADTDLLALIPGLGRDAARAIVEHRSKHGSFATLADVAALEAIDDRTFEQVGGFLRVFDGSSALDATPIHPGDYPIVEAAATLDGTEVATMLGTPHRKLDLSALCEKASCGRLRALDVLRSLEHHGRDPRGAIEIVDNGDLRSIDDVQLDKQLHGRVTNLTEFGAFVDLGIGTDGLVHISQIPPSRIRDADNLLRVGEIVTVFVVGVDPKQGRISLSMHKPRHVAEGRGATIGERLQPGGRRGGQNRGRGQGAGRGPGGRGGSPRDAQPMNRAAREPEGRRGGRRGAPRAPRAEGRDGGFGGLGGGHREGGRGGARGGGGGGGDRNPRIHTIESERETEEQRGHKGELKSLSSLKNLLLGDSAKSDSTPPAADETPKTGPETNQE